MTVPTIETTDYLNCAAAAEVLGLTAESVRVYCNNFKAGKTPAIEGMQFNEGGQWLIHKKEIARYRKERLDRGRPRGE